MDAANKRIAKNTLYMYIRLFTILFLGLYTSRIILQVLGVSDYGLFAVVGGVLTMFSFFSGSLGQATSRFLNAEMGKPDGDVNKIFNVNVALHSILAVIIFVLAETIGLWYIYNKLTVAPGKMPDAVFIYQVAIITTCAGIVNVPYLSLFSSHERFKFMTLLDIFNTLLRFCCIFLLQYYEGDYALRMYALIMCLTTANTFVVYHWIAARDWPNIIKLRIVREWSIYREVLAFVNWNLLSALAVMARNSGSDLIVNAFYGTTMNGAFAISKNVNGNVTEFSTRFDSTSAPQIIQAYAAGDKQRYTYLANKLGRINILLFLWVLFPLLIELDFLLHLWLGNVPEGTLIFTQLYLIIGGVSLTAGGLYNVIQASGKIKWFRIEMSALFLACVPIGYFFLKAGFPAYTMLILFFMADGLQRIIQLTLAHYILGFDSLLYAKESYLRPFVVICIMSGLIYLYGFLHVENSLLKCLSIVICFLINTMFIYLVGMKREERNMVRSSILNKLGKNNK